jgi:type I restriction enzyme M protein
VNHQSLSAFIWSVADLLRGDYKQSEYGRVILPFTVLRRLDCVLAPTKPAVLEAAGKNLPDPILTRAAGNTFFNRSPLDLVKLIGDQDNIATNLLSYIQGFSPEVRDIFEQFEFAAQIDRLAKNGLLYQVTERFAGIDLHPDRVDNNQMGLVFEELIRKFAEISNETAGEHFTPREVIRLMVNLIFVEDDDVLSKPSVVRSIYDPTAGTGGMLSIAGEYLHEHNPHAQLTMSGQELNPESYAICKADMLIKGQDIARIVQGNTLSDDGHPAQTFDYMLSNPPFGVEWKKVQKDVQDEHQRLGFAGRFGPGLPRVSDGSLLFLMHLLSKMRPPCRGWLPLRHRAEWLAALHRRRGKRGERDPPLCAGERSGRGDHRPAHRHVLQHRHRHLCLGAVEQEARRLRWQGAADRRQQLLAEDAQVTGLQAQADER